MRRLACLLLGCFSLHLLPAQGAPLPINEDGYDLLQRLYVRYGYAGFTAPASDLNLRPASRGDLVRLAKTYEALYGEEMSQVDHYRLQQFYDSNNEWLSLPTFAETDDADRAPFYLGEDFAVASADSPLYRRSHRPIFKTFYETPAHLLAYNRKDFYLRVNPILNFRYGRGENGGQPYFFNQRGVRLRAGIDDRVFLHFEIMDHQLGAPNYVQQFYQQTRGVPGAGLVKEATLSMLGIEDGFDYLNGAGYLSADLTRHIGVRLGYGQHFIGNGERSLFLSDFSNNYPFLEINTRIWKFHYRNLFAELTAGRGDPTVGSQLLPKKWIAAHELSLRIGERLSVGLFEAVVFSREAGFELAYLNPIILYRTVEGSVGSPDNVLIGLSADYHLPFRTEIYGQFILDEFKFDELFLERRGWWANKWAYQIGLRHVDALGVDQLDLVVERNVARPYMYSHKGPSSYTHFVMPLAHPLGANFRENLVGFDYRPLRRLHLSGRAFLIEQGEGDRTTVVGENLFQSSELRSQEYGNEIGQGIQYTNTVIQLRGGYEVRPNLWLEADYFSRSKNSALDSQDLETSLLTAGIRWNVTSRREAF